MRPRYNEKKTTQAAAKFLKLAGDSMEYLKLQKLLYMLDREALNRWGRSISNDEYFSMKLGPVLSETLDLINGSEGDDTYWSKHISAPMSYKVGLLADPGTADLSQAEETLIVEIHERYKGMNGFNVAEILHQTLPEWARVTSGRVPITHESIFKALNKPQAEIDAINAELENLAIVDGYFMAGDAC